MDNRIIIRNYIPDDRERVIKLWDACNLIFKGNDPEKDIELKMEFQPELFFVGITGDTLIATVMAGYDGHRGWLNYLGVHPARRGMGYGKALVEYSIQRLKDLNCPKLNIQVRNSNTAVIGFYQRLGFMMHEVTSMQLKF